MARALVGYVGSANERLLTVEIVRLRRRVAELEDLVAELRRVDSEAEARSLDLELHRIAESAEPVFS